MEIEITEDTFGTHPGGPDQEPRVVQRYTMTNPANGFSAQVIKIQGGNKGYQSVGRRRVTL